MTRKDFELIAGVLRYCDQHTTNEIELDLVHWVAGHLADELATTNERFDRARFLKACGVE